MKLNKLIYFYPEKPVLSMMEIIDEFSDDPNWICEPKYNGQRCELHLFEGKAEFWDRHGKHLKYNSDPNHEDGRTKIVNYMIDKFDDENYYVFDGELRHNKVTGIQNQYVIYDIHVYKGELLTNLTFKERREILQNSNLSVYNGDTVHLIYQYKDSFKTHFKSFVDGNYGDPDEFEGIVMKHLDGKLKLGRKASSNSTWMFKIRKKTGRHRY